jgi:putative transposase
MTKLLVISDLQRGFWFQPPTPDLLVHSDRGGQYCGNVYRKLLHDHQTLRSQSRRGDCYDNAQAENRQKVLSVCGRTSKPKCSKGASGPFLPT